MEIITLGERIKNVRNGLKINQADFAIKIGLESPMAISSYENNKTEPDIRKLIKISELGNISLDELLTGVKPFYPNRDAKDSLPPVESEAAKADQIKISEDLFLATRVLESGTAYATALHLNIRSFSKAIDAEERITVLETNQRVFEKKVDAEIKVLRAEVNRLKATYEDPDGGDGHLADAEKRAM